MFRSTIYGVIVLLIVVVNVFAQEFRWTEPVPVDILNTPANERYLYLSTDGNILLWNAQGAICMSRWNGDWWEPREILPEPVNSDGLEEAIAITPDHSFFYWVSWREGGMGGWDIWRCSWDEETNIFGEAELLGENVNSYAYEWSIGFTPDGKRMYFSSNTPYKNGQNGYGSDDIWYCDWDSTINDWGLAYNVGMSVNTSGDDYSPYIIRNGSMLDYILFFTSNDHHDLPEYYGHIDIFYADWDGNSWNQVHNIGEPINSPTFDGEQCLTQSGCVMYFIAPENRDPSGNGDIYVSYKVSSAIKEEQTDTTSKLNIRVYPNPYNNSCKIQVDSDELLNNLQLRIYDIQGKEVKNLGKKYSQNTNEIFWDGTNNAGVKISSGVYFINCLLNDTVVEKKAISLIK